MASRRARLPVEAVSLLGTGAEPKTGGMQVDNGKADGCVRARACACEFAAPAVSIAFLIARLTTLPCGSVQI